MDSTFAFAQKPEFTERMKRQLTEINQSLDRLDAKIEKSSDATKAAAKPKLQALREKSNQLKKQLEAGNATASTWASLKTGSMEAYGELKKGFTQGSPVGG